MSKFKRNKTKYPGVYYIEGKFTANSKPERIYYIYYRKDGKQIEEKVGRQFQHDMTPACAANIRAERIKGHQKSNKERREDIQRLKEAEANRWTFDRLWESYKESHPDLKGADIDEYRYKKHISPIFGSKEPKELSPFEVDRVRITLSKNMRPASVKLSLELIRRLSNYGENKRLCDGIGFKIQMPKVENLKTEDLSPEQLSKLHQVLNEHSNIQIANLMKMALYIGMRKGELLRLKWQDIDFDHGFIHIRNPKGGKDYKLPLNKASRALLNEHPRTDSEYVFPGRYGKQRVDIRKQVNEIKAKAGLPNDFRPLHGLRHVYGSMLASSG